MKIILATGIFPPDIGGPATYVRAVARELTARGDDVVVLTYGAKKTFERTEGCVVVSVGKQGGTIGRWLRYRKELVLHSEKADYICAFTSISAGVPMLLSRDLYPKKILRLGGDFFWERYTDAGGEMTLREWYASKFGFWRLLNTFVMGKVLRCFDQLVYSTEFQKDIHVKQYRALPPSIVESNPSPESESIPHEPHVPFRLLFMGRFVRFKNIISLIDAMGKLPDAHLTIVGEGPLEDELKERVRKQDLEGQISFQRSVSGDEKRKVFERHDLLVLPSLTEISPNTALEARAVCLPVLLTEETGLLDMPDITKKKLRDSTDIATEIREIMKRYRTPKPVHTVRTYRKISDAIFPPISR